MDDHSLSLAMMLRVALVVWFLLHSVDSCPECTSSNRKYDGDWETYKVDFEKVYESCTDECNRRLIWEGKCKYIDEFNRRSKDEESTYKIAHNKYSDWTDDEISSALCGLVLPPGEEFDESESWSTTIPPDMMMTPPLYFDYTDHGYVTSVKDQGNCGNCWAHSAAGVIEGQLFKSCDQLIDISVQQINDCCNDDIYESHGCRGGWMDGAFRCMQDTGGFVSNDVYGLKRIDQDCLIPEESEQRYVCDGYKRIKSLDESALMQSLLTVGPISCCMYASPLSFIMYKSGVYSDVLSTRGNKINHAVLITGCGTTSDGLDYWIVKNSWGNDWGEKGFFRLVRDFNLCDIAHYCYYPTNCTIAV